MLWLLLAQLAVWEPVKPPTLHQGSWQSCDHAERVLEHRVNGRPVWELHLGPDDEFGLYQQPLNGEDHRHDGPDNLLGPSYRVTADGTWRGKRNWTVPSLHLWVSIVAAGGSREQCESFYVRVETK